MRILLTGSTGLIGWELARSLLPLGEIVTLDRNQVDLGQPDSLRPLMRNIRPDVIVNAAAYTAVDKAEEEEELAARINGMAPGVMAEEAESMNAILVHYSTDYVFDGENQSPYREEDPTNPVNAYGRSKLAGETAIRNTACRHLILRTAWVYSSRGENFLLTILRLMKENESLKVVNDQIGAPTWSRLIAEVSALIIRNSMLEIELKSFSSEIFHLTAAGATSWYGFAEMVAEIAGQKLLAQRFKIPDIQPVTSKDYQTNARRPMNSRLDLSKLENKYKLAMPAWSSALRLCMEEVI